MTDLAADPRIITAARVGEVLPAEGGMTMLTDPDPFRWACRVAMQRVILADHEANAKKNAAATRRARAQGRRRRR